MTHGLSGHESEKLWEMVSSLVAQGVKNPPAKWETWVQSRAGKIPWRRAWDSLAWRIPMDRGPCGIQSTGSERGKHD